MKNNKGFQLTELLVVLAFIAIIAGLSLSIGFRAVQGAAYTGAVNKLLAEISFAKQLAARENRYILFEFNSNGYEYTIKKQVNVADVNSITEVVKIGSFFDTGGQYVKKNGEDKNKFFDGSLASTYSFVVNSMGMVFKQSDITNPNPVPSKITITVFFDNKDGSLAQKDEIIINPSGGVNVNQI